jgi:hypothetical protein
MTEILRQRLPGETRIALVDKDELTELHLLRDHDRLTVGSIHQAITRENVQGRWRADVSGDTVWLLRHLGSPHGTRLPVRVIRAPIPEPGQIKPAHVIVDQNSSARTRADWAGAVDVPEMPPFLMIDELLEQAVTGLFPFEHGVISIERTRAAVMIDVDGYADPLDLNMAAARQIARLLRLLQIGGMVIVDFAGLENRVQRQALDKYLHDHLALDPRPFECTSLNGYGTAQIVRARMSPSVIDQLCGTRRNQASLDTLALKLLETAMRSQGAGVRTLTAAPLIIARLKDWPTAIFDVQQHLGSPVHLVTDPLATGYGHVHVTPV